MNDSPAVHIHLLCSMVRLGSSRSFGLGRVLPLSTLSDLWADGHTFKKTWAKAIDKMKNENTLSVGLDL